MSENVSTSAIAAEVISEMSGSGAAESAAPSSSKPQSIESITQTVAREMRQKFAAEKAEMNAENASIDLGPMDESSTRVVAAHELRKVADTEARDMAREALPRHLHAQAEDILNVLSAADIRAVLNDYADRQEASYKPGRDRAVAWARGRK